MVLIAYNESVKRFFDFLIGEICSLRQPKRRREGGDSINFTIVSNVCSV